MAALGDGPKQGIPTIESVSDLCYKDDHFFNLLFLKTA